MKTSPIISLSLLLFFFTSRVNAQDKPGTGICFFEGSYAALLQEAQRQQKMVFIDVYTDWCGPCKQMDQQVFPLKAVGDKYNPLFISYKLNAEKGEGVALAKKFNIGAYPSFLYLDNNGYLVHKVAGEGPAEVFNTHADKATTLLADKNRPSRLEAAFNAGDRSPGFLRTYISSKARLNMDNTLLLDELLKVLPANEQHKESTLVFIGEQMIGTKTRALPLLMSRYDQLSESSRAAIRQHLYDQLAERAIPAAIGEKKLAEIKQLLGYVNQLDITTKQAAHINRINLIYAGMAKDTVLLKKSGYTMVGNSMEIAVDSIHAEDARRYQQLMAPFLSGEKDSTKVPGFQEEKPYIVNIYSREIHMKLFTAATAFSETLAPTDKALKDALQWALRAEQLIPGVKANATLITKLQEAVAGNR